MRLFVIAPANLSVAGAQIQRSPGEPRGPALAVFGQRRSMPSSPTVVAAASMLATRAPERRRTWCADPLPRPLPRMVTESEPVAVLVPALVAVAVPVPVAVHAPEYEFVEEAVELRFNDVVAAPPIELPSPSTSNLASAFAVARVVVRTAGAILLGGFESLRPLGEPAVEWLMRGAAVVSTMSVLLLIGVNRGALAARWDQTAAMATAAATSAATSATNRFAEAPPPPGPAKGSGRVNISSSSGAAQVVIDGKPRGISPLTVDLPAGPHRVVLKSEKGSVERSVRLECRRGRRRRRSDLSRLAGGDSVD